MFIIGKGRYPATPSWGILGIQLLYKRINYNDKNSVESKIFTNFFIGKSTANIQYSYPSNDISIGDWVPSTGTILYPMINEVYS